MSNHQQAKKGMNKWLVTLLTIVVIGALGATAYGMLKDSNPMTMYMKAQKNTMEDQFERMEDYTGSYKEIYDRQLEEAYETKGSVTMDLNVKGDQIQQSFPQMGMIQGIISTLKVEYNSKIDPESKETFASADLTMQGNSIANGSFYQNENTAAVQAPFVYDKYFALGNDELGAFLERMGESSEGINELPNFAEYSQTQLSFEEVEEIMQDYVVTIGKQLKEEQFSLNEGATYEGEKYDKVTVEISEEEAHEMLVAVLEELKQDERIWDILDQQSALQQGVNSVSNEDMKADIDEAIENVDSIKIPGGITIEAYLKDDLVAHQTWNMSLQPEDAEKVAMEISTDYVKEDEDRYTSSADMTFTPENEEGSVSVSYKEDGKPNKDGLHVDHTIGVNSEIPSETFTMDLILNSDFTEQGSKTDFNVELSGDALGEQPMPNISGFVNMETTEEDDDSYNRKVDYGLNFSMDDPMMGEMAADVELNVDQNISFSDDLSFPELKDGNTVRVMDQSDQELEQIAQDIQRNFQQHIGSLLGGFGGLGGF
ncbi:MULTISPECIES: DUF6583 family protein [Pontibacillus]|uniref:DUF945 family protein n=1 Tax=Pontibacillus chungwhensis TaxID=265426 RepID=A0ABY8V1D5_9BACI|nr:MULTISPECIES: DUF6583 family protein [Pontibacillus]MCD5324848.1 hypothetical protein [Pontibacillus sp. HN14]WIF98806.1 hypothetical protein QNI29_03900 [Pontibacillus chungwhensis]